MSCITRKEFIHQRFLDIQEILSKHNSPSYLFKESGNVMTLIISPEPNGKIVNLRSIRLL